MKRLIQLALLALSLVGTTAQAATYYVRDCGTGASGTCAANASGDTYTIAQVQNQATPIKTCARVKSLLFATSTTMAAGGNSILFAKGGAWDSCNMLSLINTNSTAANPIVFGSYDPGGESAAPILNTNSGVTMQFEDSGNSDHDEGYVVQDLQFNGLGTGQTAITMRGDVDYVTIQRNEITGYSGGVQCDGGTNQPQNGGSDGLTEHITIRDNNLHHNTGNALLIGCNDVLIENNLVDNSGAELGDHHIYLDDMDLGGVSPLLSQIVIRGNTMTNNTPYRAATVTISIASPAVITDTSHPLSANDPIKFTTTNALPTGLVTSQKYYVKTVLSANTYTVSSTPGGAEINTSGTQAGTQKVIWLTPVAGGCKSTAVIVHGRKRGIIFDKNILGEPTTPTSFNCWGVSIDSGVYGGIYSAEGLEDVFVRSNVLYNFYFGIGIDITHRAEVSNNYYYSEFATNPECWRMRAKYYSAIDSDDFHPDATVWLNNSCFLLHPGAATVGMRWDQHASDSTSGGNHKFIGNLINFGTGSTSATACVSYRNRTAAEFAAVTDFDYNLCNFEGTVGVWANDGTTASPTTKTLANWRTATGGFDTNSSQTNTAASVIFAATPASGNGYSLATKTTSPTKNACIAGCSSFSVFGIVRSGTPDIGAFQFGQSSDHSPPPPTRIRVQ